MGKIRFVYVRRFFLHPPPGILFWPHLVLISRGLTEHMGALGAAFGPIIVLHPEYKRYLGVLVHEQQHVRQWWYCTLASLPVFLLYTLASGRPWYWLVAPLLAGATFGILMQGRMFRLRCEIAASRQELRLFSYAPPVAERLTDALTSDLYQFGVSREVIYADLVKGTPLERHAHAS